MRLSAHGGFVLLLRLFGLCVSLLLASFEVAHAEITLSRIPIDGKPPIILVKGEFTQSDSSTALAQEVAASGAKLVTFDSDGGNVLAAMAYGRTIRSLGLATFQLRAAQCASACTLAFVGGVTRQAEPGAIGVHQSSFSPGTDIDGQAAVAAVQSMTAQIMTYLIEMDVDPRLLQLSLSVPSDDMRYLTSSEMQVYKVTSGRLADFPGSLPQTNTPTASTSTPPVSEPTPGTSEKPTTLVVTPTTEQRAIAFTTAYHDAWSHGNSEALAFMEKAYSQTVDFYGKPVPKEAVIGEKHDFATRWPIRAYSVKPKLTHVVCTQTCNVDGVVDWFAKRDNGERTSSGTAEFSLVWDPKEGTIVSESGKVLDTDKGANQPVRLITQWEELNRACRGGLGDSPDTQTACAARETVGSKLEGVGWCYGRPGEYGYQMDWHACPAASSGPGMAVASATNSTGDPRPMAGDYPIEGRYSGTTVLPDFKVRDRDFNSFRTRIREGLREGPNFAGHFTLIQIGCGAGCSFVIVADNNTGRPSKFPVGGESNMDLELLFTSDSRMVTTQWYSYDLGKCFREFFDFHAGTWKSLSKTAIGDEQTCFNTIAENMH